MLSPAAKQRMHNATQEFVVMTLYLWIIFALFDIYRSVLVAQYHLSLVARSFAIINAIALAKIAVIVRALKLDKHLRRAGRPLIYSTVLNATLFTVLLACFKLLEEAVVGIHNGKTLAESLAEFGRGGHGTVWLIAIFFVMLIPFCAFSELGVVLGTGTLARLFFRRYRAP